MPTGSVVQPLFGVSPAALLMLLFLVFLLLAFAFCCSCLWNVVAPSNGLQHPVQVRNGATRNGLRNRELSHSRTLALLHSCTFAPHPRSLHAQVGLQGGGLGVEGGGVVQAGTVLLQRKLDVVVALV